MKFREYVFKIWELRKLINSFSNVAGYKNLLKKKKINDLLYTNDTWAEEKSTFYNNHK